MEIGSFSEWDSILEDEVVTQVEPPTGVWLRSNYPDRLIVYGSVSGKRYEFGRSGVELEVDADDVPEMLLKVFGSYSCCGGNGKPLPKFSLV
jgi:hypothetical protein